jgi:hypothetical protein
VIDDVDKRCCLVQKQQLQQQRRQQPPPLVPLLSNVPGSGRMPSGYQDEPPPALKRPAAMRRRRADETTHLLRVANHLSTALQRACPLSSWFLQRPFRRLFTRASQSHFRNNHG